MIALVAGKPTVAPSADPVAWAAWLRETANEFRDAYPYCAQRLDDQATELEAGSAR